MLNNYEELIKIKALELISNAYKEWCKKFLDDDIVFYVPISIKKAIKANKFKGKKIKLGYEDNKIIIANFSKFKVKNIIEFYI